MRVGFHTGANINYINTFFLSVLVFVNSKFCYLDNQYLLLMKLVYFNYFLNLMTGYYRCYSPYVFY